MDILIYILGIIGLIFMILQIIFSALYHLRLNRVKKVSKADETISVLIPYYNEVDENIQRALDSLSVQKGVKLEVVLVDDGNRNAANVSGDKFDNFKHIHMSKNMGKRHALYQGVKGCSGKYLVVVDSDTIIKEDAIIELYNLIKLDGIGCVCGNVLIENEKQNILTLLISCMYWFAFHMERASQSYFNSQTVCSGALSMYLRKEYEEYSESLINQVVMGQKSVAGDDRHMTNQFLLHGWGSVWAKDAIAWTETPHTIRTFIKQQLRWTRSFVLEIIWLFEKWRIKGLKLASQYFILKNFFKYLYALFFYIIGIYFIVVNPWWVLLFSFCISLFTVLAIKGLLAWVFSNRAMMVLITMGFGILGYVVLTPFLLYGVFTCRKSGWGTRNKKI